MEGERLSKNKFLIDRIASGFTISFNDDKERRRKQLFYLELILAFISTVMSIINIISQKNELLIATAGMAVFSFTNAFIFFYSKNNIILGTWIFVAKMFILFNYFIIFGGTEGFSTIWLLLTPACAPIVFGKKRGSIMSLLLLLELVVLFYTPLRGIVIQCEYYTNSFIARFPVLYICFFFIGYYLEYIREKTYCSMMELQKEIEYQSTHDQLTGLNNRVGLKKSVDEFIATHGKESKFGFLIIDVDDFKKINDRWGHMIGDNVLKEVAKRISGVENGEHIIACRWGGEEFAAFIDGRHCEDLYLIAEKIRTDVAQPIELNNEFMHITVSVGGACSDELSELEVESAYSKMLSIADERMYMAKQKGKNCSIYFEAADIKIYTHN